MYGRTSNNIFSRSNNTSTSNNNNIFNRNTSNNNNSSYGNSNNNSSYGNNSYGNNNSNYGNNNYNNKNSNRFGTYRVTSYNSTNAPRYMEDINPRWKQGELNPMSIVSRHETMHLSATELRVEDYYLMRTNRLQRDEQKLVKDAIDKNVISSQIMNSRIVSNLKAPVSFSDGEPSLDVLKQINKDRQLWGSGGSSSNSYNNNSYNNNNTNSSNNNIFNRNSSNNNSSTNNIFNRTSSNNTSSNNIFGKNNNTSNNSNTNNIFSSSNNNNTNRSNIFSNNNNSSGGNNIFANNNNNNSSANNIFSRNNNSNNNSSGGNIFNTNNNNNNTSNNIFNRNSTNNNNNNNIFNNNTNNNNNNSSNNIFNTNRSSNNIFSNNNNSNSSNSRNIFNNNSTNNNTTGNNIFNNNNNTNNNNNDNQKPLYITQQTFMQFFHNQSHLIKTLLQKNNYLSKIPSSTLLNYQPTQNPYHDNVTGLLINGDYANSNLFASTYSPNKPQTNFKSGFSLPPEREDFDLDRPRGYSKQSQNVYKPPSLFQSTIKPLFTHHNNISTIFNNNNNNNNNNKNIPSNINLNNNNEQHFQSTTSMFVGETVVQNNIFKNTSLRNNINQEQQLPSLLNKSDHNRNSIRTSRIFNNNNVNQTILYTCILKFPEEKQKPTTFKQRFEKQLTLKATISISEHIRNVQQWFHFNKNKSNRDYHLQKVQINDIQELQITATVYLIKINLPQGYFYKPRHFQGFQVNGLEITNQYGSVRWLEKLNIRGVDFTKGLSIDRNKFNCQIPQLDQQCIVTFNTVPPQVAHANETDARKSLETYFQKLTKGVITVESFSLNPPEYRLRIRRFIEIQQRR